MSLFFKINIFLEARAEILSFLVYLKTPRGHFEINWPLEAQLELSCCKKRQKISGQETGLGNRERLKVLNDTKLVLNEHEWPPSSFRINLVSFRTFRHPLLPKLVSWLGLFCRFLQQDGSTIISNIYHCSYNSAQLSSEVFWRF